MATILESLKAEHVKFRRYLDMFESEVAKYETGESVNYPLVDLLLEYFTTFPDEWHHKKEDHVYDALAAAPRDEARALYDLRAEHERLTDGAKRFAAHIEHLRMGGDLSADVLQSEGRRYTEQLRRHMMREDTELIPLAERRLADEQWRAISTAISEELARSGGKVLAAKLAAMEERIEDAARHGA